ncbi:hypothetical protein [Nocardia abscessus]|uniref:hypothetical protein n=1 Tax=Nocardia abscessus TaxID=120957 RepID=UPI0024584197|nr:hypothetical protein [Nocardia abscessus]
MPLPTSNTPWPPRHLADAFGQYSTCQVWWEGDADKLSASSGEPSRATVGGGGFMQRIRRLFWGTSRDAAQQPRQLHVPVAADIVQTAATVLLPEPVTFRPADDDTIANPAARKRIDKILNSPQTHAGMVSAAEACSALGDVYGRIVWNADICDHAWIDWVDADAAIPEFMYGRLWAVTFWTVVDENTDENRVLRHLERHEAGYHTIDEDGERVPVWGRIYHGLYEGTAVSLGRRIDLAAHSETASIPVVEGTDFVYTGSMRLTAWHIANGGRNPAFRAQPVLQHLGRSDIGDPAVIGLMDQIDETYSSLSRDVRLAKARLLVSEFLLDMKSPGKPATFSTEQEIYERVGGAPSATPVLEAHQFQIRVADHLQTAEGYLRAILRRIGFSPFTFGLADQSGGPMTATEVDAKRDATTATYKARSGAWRSVLAGAARTLIEVDAAVFGTGATLGQDLEVSWPPAARESLETKARNLGVLASSRSASMEWRVRYLNPTYDDTAVADEVKKIRDDDAVADPLALGADQPFAKPEPEPDPEPDEGEAEDDTGDDDTGDEDDDALADAA